MKSGVRFGPRMNRWFYAVFTALFFSGVLWLFAQPGTVGSWLLRVHGAAAMLSLIVLGVMIPSHMRRAWEQRRNRLTAIVITSICVLLIVSGYGLYYWGGEESRAFISWFHVVLGCLLPAILVTHIVVGRRRKGAVNSVAVRPQAMPVLHRKVAKLEEMVL